MLGSLLRVCQTGNQMCRFISSRVPSLLPFRSGIPCNNTFTLKLHVEFLAHPVSSARARSFRRECFETCLLRSLANSRTCSGQAQSPVEGVVTKCTRRKARAILSVGARGRVPRMCSCRRASVILYGSTRSKFVLGKQISQPNPPLPKAPELVQRVLLRPCSSRDCSAYSVYLDQVLTAPLKSRRPP